MLQFTGMTIENFGPFKGTQEVEFSNEAGVTIIWGNNGRGKTTLLNIIRYALFGKYQNRRGGDVELSSLVNIEAKKDNVYDFKVVLKMINDGVVYELTRQYSLRKNVVVPRTNDDYEERIFLKKNNSILSPDQRDHELNMIMPQEVSRFFLFDGELLEEYEELLMEDTSTGATIKNSIEQILGVPVLTHGASDTAAIFEEYRTAKNKIAQSNEKTRKIAAQMQVLEAEKVEHQSEIERLQNDLLIETNKRDKLENAAKQSEHISDLLKKLEDIDGTIKEKEALKEATKAQIVVATGEAWKGLISSRVEKIIATIDTQLSVLQEKDNAHKVACNFIEDMKKAANNHHCHLCDQDISAEKLDALIKKIASTDNEYGGLSDAERERFQDLQMRRATLSKIKGDSKKEVLDIYETQLAALDVEIDDANRKKKEIRAELELHGDIGTLSVDARANARNLADCLKKIDNDKDGISKERKKLDEAKNGLISLEENLNRQATDSETIKAKRKVELCEEIANIFEEGIAAYRDKLKKDVERDATELFVQISNDKDYTKLQINDNYGLYMVHKDGQIVPLRSAGFEHVVALSLIGALHKNAPLRGPIIMDSPFGRLDPDHKSNITKTLPQMSDQIILLAYTHEINEQYARETLGTKLKKEYRLQKYSSFNTQIEAQ